MPFEYQPGVQSTAGPSYSSGNKNALNLLISLMTPGTGDPDAGPTGSGNPSANMYHKVGEPNADWSSVPVSQGRGVSGY